MRFDEQLTGSLSAVLVPLLPQNSNHHPAAAAAAFYVDDGVVVAVLVRRRRGQVGEKFHAGK